MDRNDVEYEIHNSIGDQVMYDLVRLVGSYALYDSFEYRISPLDLTIHSTKSTAFERMGYPWTILFFPKGNGGSTFAVYLSLEVAPSKPIYVGYEISILHPVDPQLTWTRRWSGEWEKKRDDGFNEGDYLNYPICLKHETISKHYRFPDGTVRIRVNVQPDIKELEWKSLAATNERSERSKLINRIETWANTLVPTISEDVSSFTVRWTVPIFLKRTDQQFCWVRVLFQSLCGRSSMSPKSTEITAASTEWLVCERPYQFIHHCHPISQLVLQIQCRGSPIFYSQPATLPSTFSLMSTDGQSMDWDKIELGHCDRPSCLFFCVCETPPL
jgi:hypothetical protein